MPPLPRSPTHTSNTSIFSWWSDNNPGLRGATINLHTLTKPLLRRMRHRQALDFINTNRDAPLSGELMSTFSSYLSAAVLSELRRRAGSIEDSPGAMVEDLFALYGITSEMLKSPQPVSPQRPPSSIHSWWSNSNPGLQGATINLHVLARPLLRRMYHRQALDLVKRNRDKPLSSELLYIISGYLPVNYVWPATKVVILSELLRRARKAAILLERSGQDRQDDRRTIVDDAFVLHQITSEMLESPHTEVRKVACELLGTLCNLSSTTPVILRMDGWIRLVNLLRRVDDHESVIEQAVYALCKITQSTDGADAAVEAKVLDRVVELLDSSNEGILSFTCQLVATLAMQESTALAVLRPVLCVTARGKHGDIVKEATYALIQITRWSDGVKAVVFSLLVNLGSHRGTNVDDSDSSMLRQLTSKYLESPPRKLRNLTELAISAGHHFGVIQNALPTRDQSSKVPDDSDILLATNAFSDLLASSPTVQQRTCSLVRRLAEQRSTARTLLAVDICRPLVFLLWGSHDNGIVGEALHALAQIALWPDGSKAAVDANVLDYIGELLESSSTEKYEDVIHGAIYALAQVAKWPGGAQQVVDANALNCVSESLKSSHPYVCRLTRVLLGNLALHESAISKGYVEKCQNYGYKLGGRSKHLLFCPKQLECPQPLLDSAALLRCRKDTVISLAKYSHPLGALPVALIWDARDQVLELKESVRAILDQVQATY
ncbi:armadillo-type protein [Mycena pura]|uniref:Armadillo-type protein n=1 Tax=Mycena pura TaxID=153505 RepID=A0AAD6VJY0_9AGAR|nr:armadillo-type protein [Mycena pura]